MACRPARVIRMTCSASLPRRATAWRVVVQKDQAATPRRRSRARWYRDGTLKPPLVLLELGGNDGLRGLPLAMTRENLDQMIAAFERVGARVVLAGMTLPPNYGPDYIHSFEAIYSGLAAKYKLPLIPFLLRDIATQDMRYFQRDGIHPTAEGAQIVSNTVFRAIKPLLGAVKN